VNFMNEYQGQWEKAAHLKAMRAYNGAVLMHDALPTGNSATNPEQRALLAARERFGIGDENVRFVGYWQRDAGLACPTKDVYLAAWLHPGTGGASRLLLAVVNRGEKTDAAVTLDATKLGLGTTAAWRVTDIDAGQAMPTIGADGKCEIIAKWDPQTAPILHDGKGRLTVPVQRHDYRQIVIEVGP